MRVGEVWRSGLAWDLIRYSMGTKNIIGEFIMEKNLDQVDMKAVRYHVTCFGTVALSKCDLRNWLTVCTQLFTSHLNQHWVRQHKPKYKFTIDVLNSTEYKFPNDIN